MRNGNPRLFLAALIPAVLAGAALILLTPALVAPERGVPLAIPVILGLILVAGATIAHSARPPHP